MITNVFTTHSLTGVSVKSTTAGVAYLEIGRFDREAPLGLTLDAQDAERLAVLLLEATGANAELVTDLPAVSTAEVSGYAVVDGTVMSLDISLDERRRRVRQLLALVRHLEAILPVDAQVEALTTELTALDSSTEPAATMQESYRRMAAELVAKGWTRK